MQKNEIFISWSKRNSLSHKVAILLQEYIPKIIQTTKCFVSSNSIESGQLWFNELNKALMDNKIAIFCITKDSLNAKWLNFEAGVIYGKSNNTKVIPFLVDVTTDYLKNSPLSLFQVMTYDSLENFKQGILSIKISIANDYNEKLLIENINNCYHELKQKIENLITVERENIYCIDDIRRSRILLPKTPSFWIPLEKNFCDVVSYKECKTNVFPHVTIVGETVDKVEFINRKGYKFKGKNLISVHREQNLPSYQEARTFIFAVYPIKFPKKEPMFFFSYGQRKSHNCGDGVNNHDKSFGIFWGEPKPRQKIKKKFKGIGLRIFFYCEHCKKDRSSKYCDTPVIVNLEDINKWYILAVTYNGKKLKLYLNGEKVFDEVITLKTSETPVLNIGGFVHHDEKGAMVARDLDYTMHGYIREFMMFRECLTKREIKKVTQSIRSLVKK